MNQEVILGIVRHVLTGIGGVLVTKGITDSAGLEQGVGAVIALAGFIWSIVHKGQVQNQIKSAALSGEVPAK